MSSVLRALRITRYEMNDARLNAYIERCLARPAFQRAYDAQLADFKAAA
jgi:glutathione S-transferase